MSLGYWGRRAAGVLIIAEDTQEVLLLLRSEQVESPGVFGIPGGKLDGNEDPLTAARREVGEEIGAVRADPERLRILREPIDVWNAPDADFSFTTFVGVVKKTFVPNLNWENDDFQWDSINNFLNPSLYVPDSIHPNVRKVLIELERRLRWPSRHRAQVTPRRFYVSIGFSPHYAAEEGNERYRKIFTDHMGDLVRGRLRGMAGISDSVANVYDWFSMMRDAMLVMDGPETIRINTNRYGSCLYRLQYGNANFLMAEGMAALKRIYQARGDSDRQWDHCVHNLMDSIRAVALKSHDSTIHRLADALRWHGGRDWVEDREPFNSPGDMARWLTKHTNRDRIPLRYEAALSLVSEAIVRSASSYRRESEWLIKTDAGCDGSLLVPAGTGLYIKVHNKPEHYMAGKPGFGYAQSDAAIFEAVQKYGLMARYNVHFVTHRDMEKYQKVVVGRY